MNVSVKEAQEQLPQLLDRVEQGEQITITRDGKPVAKLLSSPAGESSWAEVFAAIEPIRRGKHVDAQTIRESINEGRRF